MRNVNISNFRREIFTYINQAIEFNEPINISAKTGNAVVLSEQEYNGLVETLYLLGNPTVRNELLDGMKAKASDLIDIDWKKDFENESKIYKSSKQALQTSAKQQGTV